MDKRCLRRFPGEPAKYSEPNLLKLSGAIEPMKPDYKKNYVFARDTYGILGLVFLLGALLCIVGIVLPRQGGGCLRAPSRWIAVFPIAIFGLSGFLCVRRSFFWHRMISSGHKDHDDPPTLLK